MSRDVLTEWVQPVATDDVASLKRYVKAAEFAYVDIRAEQAHQKVLGRWPLLLELECSLKDKDRSPDTASDLAVYRADRGAA